jgi:lipoprotein-releasing system ATP-binding protein
LGKPLVVVEDLRKSFLHMGHELQVLRGIDLSIGEGEVVAVVGPSGAGKSTLLHCIGTLDLPTGGSIRMNGEELVGLGGRKLADIRNRTIGFVFQFHHLLPEFNALENVMMPGLVQGLGRGEVERRARTLLDEVGLAARATHRPGELSGGEQQRVALARALLLSPKLLLADEPTGNLDSANSDAIHQLFFDVNKAHGTTVVVVTHNTRFAEQMPRVVRLVDGRIDADSAGPTAAPEPTPSVRAHREAMARMRPATFWPRALARLCDRALHQVVAVGVGWGVATMAQPIGLARIRFQPGTLVAYAGLLFVGTVVAQIAYGTLAEWIGGATLGKGLLGLRVRTQRMRRAGLGAAFVRNVFYLIDALFFGLVAYLAMMGTALEQRVGDRLAGTVVVSERHEADKGGETGEAVHEGIRIAAGIAVGLFVYTALLFATAVGALAWIASR